MREPEADKPGLVLKIGIAGVIGLGAVVSGLLISRQGRRLVKEAWQGRRRTRLEDRVLDAIWSDDLVGRCAIDVKESAPGTVELSGPVGSRRERARALRVAARVRDVQKVEDRLEVVRETAESNGRPLSERRRIIRRAREIRQARAQRAG